MFDEHRLEELFAEWRRTRANPEDLCRNDPDLLAALQEKIVGGATTCEKEVNAPLKVATVADPTPKITEPIWVDGRYQLTRFLGRGGFGEVWKAFDNTLRRTVALKLPRRDHAFDEKRRKLFLHEARKIASLEHPNIVRVFDAVAEHLRCYLVCDYIEGGNLRERMNARPFSPEEAARLIATIAEALHAAHRCDIVHRDVKPDNILLGKDDKPLLTDFGLAISEKELLDESPGTLGTFAYMSPEQARGDSNQVDGRSDIYSLGVVFYQLLTGRLPYVAKNHEEYREQILHRPARPPRTINDKIPAELEAICLRCLNKQPEQRFTTARDLAEALSRALTPRPKRNPWKWVAALAVLVAAVATPLVLLSQKPDPPPPTPKPQPEITEHFDEDRLGIKPNVWYSLLRWKPNKLSFPSAPPSRLDWEPGGLLNVHCADCGLVTLGSAKRPGYELRFKMRQETWHGGFGFFLGYHLAQDDRGTFARYQLFKIDRTIVMDEPRLALNHILAKELDLTHLGRPGEVILEGAFARLPPPKYCEFSCVVDHRGVHSIFWNGEPVPNLGTKNVNAQLLADMPAVFHGEFGILTRAGTTSVSEASVRFTDKYCENRVSR